MKHSFLLFLAGLSLMIFGSSCRKYQEGPGLSFRSKMNRLCGEWYAEEFTWQIYENAMEEDQAYVPTGTLCRYDVQPAPQASFITSCDSISAYIGAQFRITDLEVTFNKNNTFSISYYYDNNEFDENASFAQCSTVFARKAGREVISGTWIFTGKKEFISLSGFNYPKHFPALLHAFGVSAGTRAYKTEPVKAEILKLKEENIKLCFYYTSIGVGVSPTYDYVYILALKNKGN